MLLLLPGLSLSHNRRCVRLRLVHKHRHRHTDIQRCKRHFIINNANSRCVQAHTPRSVAAADDTVSVASSIHESELKAAGKAEGKAGAKEKAKAEVKSARASRRGSGSTKLQPTAGARAGLFH